MLSAAAVGQPSLVQAKGARTVNNTQWLPQRLHVRGLVEPEETH